MHNVSNCLCCLIKGVQFVVVVFIVDLSILVGIAFKRVVSYCLISINRYFRGEFLLEFKDI